MLELAIPERELFIEQTQEFRTVKAQTLQLEHSLVSLSKWESKWHIPFLDKKDKTDEQILDYVRCMTITQHVNPDVYLSFTPEIFDTIQKYIANPMTATWFSERENKKPQKEVITSEVIYCWMVAQNIPVEFQKWHLNRLLTLIRVCSIKNAPPGTNKMSKREAMNQQRDLNAERRARLNSKG